MGSSVWDARAYAGYSHSVKSKTRSQIFKNVDGCHKDLDPTKFSVRESCDSEQNPNSTPIIIGVDETGSMGILAEEIIKGGLGVIVEGIRDRKPVPDPHILLAALGDCYCDIAPIQTTQFEADTCIVQQIEKFYLEGNGGGNQGESYPALWWFALNKTRCDAINKRGSKGFLFTIGDEAPHPILKREHIQKFMKGNVEADVDIDDLLSDVEQQWEVFHLITPTAATQHQHAVKTWKQLLCERAINMKDHSKLGEVIVSIMQVIQGEDHRKVVDSWDKSTALVVGSAIDSLVASGASTTDIDVVDA